MDIVQIAGSLLPGQDLVYVAAACGLAAAITANIPAPKSGVFAGIWRVLNLLGHNYGHAKNAASN
jgi:hypothetical protein